MLNNFTTLSSYNFLTKHFRPYLNRMKSVHFDDRYLMLKFDNKSVGHPIGICRYLLQSTPYLQNTMSILNNIIMVTILHTFYLIQKLFFLEFIIRKLHYNHIVL